MIATTKSRCDRVIAVILSIFMTVPYASAKDDYPRQTVKIVVPFVAGGGVDIVARLVGPRLSELLGQSIVIENRGGAGGALGASAVAQAAPDGYTLLLGTGSTHGTNSSIYARLSYDPVRDFVPIALLSTSPLVLVAKPALLANSAQELIALAKAKPDQLGFGSYGPGSINHLAGELFNSLGAIQTNHIPYRGSAPMMTDLIGGRIDYAFDGVSTSLGYIQAKSVKMLGTTGTSRSPLHPNEPTITESALPGFDAMVWFGLFAPAGTPKPIVDMLNGKVNVALAAPAVRAGLEKLGFEPVGGGPEVLAQKVESEMQKWVKIVREKNIRVDQ